MSTKSTSRLRAVREAQGLSQRKVAQQAGYDVAYLSRVERGLQKPSLAFLVAVGRVLGLRNLTETIGLFWSPDDD